MTGPSRGIGRQARMRTPARAGRPWQSARARGSSLHILRPRHYGAKCTRLRHRHRISFLAERLACIKPSPTTAMTALAAELQLAGRDIISLSQDEPDFGTPAKIREAAIAAIHCGETRDTVFDGRIELNRAACDKFKRENGSTTSRRRSRSAGCKQLLLFLSYPEMVLLCAGTLVPVARPHKNGFKIDPEDLEAERASGPWCRAPLRARAGFDCAPAGRLAVSFRGKTKPWRRTAFV
jgi:hypothetical protein